MKHLSRTDLSGMECAAIFSDDDVHRFVLSWIWDRARPMLVAFMLNPSTATHEVLDPTVAGLIKRARAWGYGGVIVINLFAIRATDPRDMLKADDPIGADNDAQIERVLCEARDAGSVVIAAWGKHGNHRDRAAQALDIARRVGVQLHALQVNADGTPKHPLYVRHDIKPTPWG
jgi:hypothetical protein